MATKTWRGDAVAVAQESRATPANVAINDVFTLTVNGKTVSFTATAATVANVTAGLTTAWNAATAAEGKAEFAEVTASDQTTYVKLLADTAGKPFTVTGSSTGDGIPADTLTISTPTASAGPNHWDTAGNWSPSGVPVAADDVSLINSATNILYGLDQNAVTLTSLTIEPTFTGQVGLPKRNAGGYFEYREDFLKISVTTLTVKGGGGRVKINLGTVVATVNVSGTGAPLETNLEALLLKGTSATNVLNVTKGSVGVAVFAGETATIATLRVGYRDSISGDANVRCGSGTTLTTLDQTGGTLETASAATTVTLTAGTLNHTAGAVTTLNLDGGTVNYTSTGTITTANVGDGGSLDFSRDMRARTVTTANLFSGGSIKDPHKSVTWTNGIDLERAAIADVTIHVGTHVKLTPGVPA